MMRSPSSLAGIHQSSRVRNAFSKKQKEFGKRGMKQLGMFAELCVMIFHKKRGI